MFDLVEKFPKPKRCGQPVGSVSRKEKHGFANNQRILSSGPVPALC